MREKRFLFLTIQQVVIIVYFVLTSVIFLLALNKDNLGIALSIPDGGDSYFYWEQAINVSQGRNAILTSIYPLIIGYLLKITGIESVYLIRLFNFFGFLLLILLSYCLIKLLLQFEHNNLERNYLYDAKTILLVCFLCYFSLLMYVNLSIFRDIWIYALYIMSILLSIKIIFQKNNKLFFTFLLLPIVWTLGEFRKYALLAFILSILIYYLYKILRKRFRAKFILFLIFIIFGSYYTLLIDFNVPFVNMSLRDVLNYRWTGLTDFSGGSQMNIRLDEANFLLFFINYIYSYIGNLIGPLPWHIRGIRTLLVFLIESMPMVLILWYLWKKRSLLNSIQKYILLHSFVWIGLIAISNDNIGTATRLRAIGWILILIVFVVTYTNAKYNKYAIKK